MATPMDSRDTGPSAFDVEDLLGRCLGRPQLALRILRSFGAHAPRYVGDLRAAVAQGDVKAVRLSSHSLKGAAANASAAGLVRLARDVEQSALAGDLAAVTRLLAALGAEVDRCVAGVEAAVGALELELA